mmetsp:Transcript_34592/g.86935  ORF Transcript_34592/g.86935 Transcript_34592/m.86935 type:complete len:264 (+) Transcript_34592:337-1128(+)
MAERSIIFMSSASYSGARLTIISRPLYITFAPTANDSACTLLFWTSSVLDTIRLLAKLSCSIFVDERTSASFITPLMSSPFLVRRLSARLSDLRCSFPAMHEEMMMPDGTPSFLLDRSTVSVGLTPRSSSMGNGWPSTLMLCTLLLVRASQIALIASSVNSLLYMLPQSMLLFKLTSRRLGILGNASASFMPPSTPIELPAMLMLCTLLLVRASQMALIASRVNVPWQFWATPQSWLLSKFTVCRLGIWVKASASFMPPSSPR